MHNIEHLNMYHSEIKAREDRVPSFRIGRSLLESDHWHTGEKHFWCGHDWGGGGGEDDWKSVLNLN